jgi:F0F1-type ATP synthase delta subunit
MKKISHREVARYAVDMIDSGTEVREVALLLAAYLVESRQTRTVTSLLRAIEAELHHRGQTQITITSRYTVSEDIKHHITTILRVSNPVYNEIIDSSVLGGVHARAGELEIDLTVRGKIRTFTQQIVNAS